MGRKVSRAARTVPNRRHACHNQSKCRSASGVPNLPRFLLYSAANLWTITGLRRDPGFNPGAIHSIFVSEAPGSQINHA